MITGILLRFRRFNVQWFPDGQAYFVCMQGHSQGFPLKLGWVILLVFMKPRGVIQKSNCEKMDHWKVQINDKLAR